LSGPAALVNLGVVFVRHHGRGPWYQRRASLALASLALGLVSRRRGRFMVLWRATLATAQAPGADGKAAARQTWKGPRSAGVALLGALPRAARSGLYAPMGPTVCPSERPCGGKASAALRLPNICALFVNNLLTVSSFSKFYLTSRCLYGIMHLHPTGGCYATRVCSGP